jgi:molybdopterin converting factor small subunit
VPRVRFTRHLRLHFPELRDVDVEAATLAELVAALDRIHPGLAGYLTDERGALRKHVNIFVNGGLLRDRAALGDGVAAGDEVFVMQALSGG